MAKFKKGDRVRMIKRDSRHASSYRPGDTGTVDEDGNDIPWVIWDRMAISDNRFACSECCLELIDDPKDKRIAELEARVAKLEAV